jgi:hypothetical protein
LADIWVKDGDSAPQIERTLLDGERNPVDIEGATVRFIMAPIMGGESVIDDVATNAQVDTGVDGTLGNVSYGWESIGPAAGGYRAEFEVTFAGGAIETFPNSGYLTVAVLADLDEVSSS